MTITKLIKEKIYRDSKTWYAEIGRGIFSPHLTNFCRQHAGKRILDFGCATGGYCLELKRLGFECVGVDINEEYIKIAQQKGVEAYLIKDRLPFDDNSFDTVIMFELLEHVQNLDECLIIIPRSVFNMLTFDEGVCDDWHLYAVDYCLSVRKLDFDAYAIPMFIYHRSTCALSENLLRVILSLGPLPKRYYQTVGKLLRKHKNHVNRVYTTMGDWSTSQPLVWQRMVKLTIYLLVKLRFPGYLYRKSGLKYLWKKFWKRGEIK